MLTTAHATPAGMPSTCRMLRPVLPSTPWASTQPSIMRRSMRSLVREPGIGRFEILAHDVGQKLHAGHRRLAVESVDQEVGGAVHRLQAAGVEAGLHDALLHL